MKENQMENDARTSSRFSRRELLAGAGSSLLLTASPLGVNASPAKPDRALAGADGKLFDLLIKGGKVIDPSQELEEVCDVALRDGKIARLEHDIPNHLARQVVDATGNIVTSGLIDIHTHVFPNIGPYGIEPDPYCVTRGVTTALDAGTSGAFTFPAFRKFVISSAATRVRALLHVVSIGMVTGSTPHMGELEDLRYCDPQLAVQAAEENRDLIVGFKIRFSEKYTGPNDLEGLKRARAAADQARLPLMTHIGGSFTPLPQLLSMLKKGDVVTHSFNSLPHGIVDPTGNVLPEVHEARQRGVLFDVGHGAGSFSFGAMEKCMHQGFLPDTISTDLYSANIHGPVYDMTTTLSKFLLLGMRLPEVLMRCTINAAKTFNFGAEIGTLKPGAEGDVSILDLVAGDFTFTDSDGKTRAGQQKLTPVVTVRAGKLYYPAAG
jgi:dihydroorotase